MAVNRIKWSNPSVLQLARERDPVEVVTELAQAVVLEAMDAGWTGPPFDPLALAEHLRLRVIGRSDIRDARIVPVGKSELVIEYNPNRPAARVRYSLAHEIAHTLFPDCSEQIRNRAARHEIEGDEWQLEALCNIAAAEFLMPLGTLPHLSGAQLSIDALMEARKIYQVSPEALLIRIARLASAPCAAFCASRYEEGQMTGRYRVDYTIPSPAWGHNLPRSFLLPPTTRVQECTGIGFTAKSTERWPAPLGDTYLECVGVSPYPGASFPRVVGLLYAEQASSGNDCLTYLVGDATKPRGDGTKIIAHIVNDGAPRWGAGFAAVVGRRWPQVQEEFISWVGEDRRRLKLGHTHSFDLDRSQTVVHLIAQRGYGNSSTPRIRYAALRDCLEQLAISAQERNASVHMPRIGAGQAGGRWELIEELITSTLCAAGISVYVYDLPNQPVQNRPQFALELTT